MIEREWRNEDGERLRVVVDEEGRATLYHSDYDDVPLRVELQVRAFEGIDEVVLRASEQEFLARALASGVLEGQPWYARARAVEQPGSSLGS